MNDKTNSSETEIGALITKYKVPAIILIVVVLLIPIGFGGYIHLKSQREEAYGEKIYNFSQESISALKDNKLKPSEFIVVFKALMMETDYFKGNFPLLIEACDELLKVGNLKEAKELLEFADEKFSGNNGYTKFLIDTRLALVYEDLGEVDKSITLLQASLNNESKILEGKTHLDLGRFYLKKGNKEKAKEKFLYVINNFDEENYKKLARLYMSKL